MIPDMLNVTSSAITEDSAKHNFKGFKGYNKPIFAKNLWMVKGDKRYTFNFIEIKWHSSGFGTRFKVEQSALFWEIYFSAVPFGSTHSIQYPPHQLKEHTPVVSRYI